MSKQERFVDIYTLDDLTALVNHNFQAFDKRVGKLARRSRTATVFAVAVFAVAAIGCAVLSEMERRKQEEQIYQLTVRVKKLERSEGE